MLHDSGEKKDYIIIIWHTKGSVTEVKTSQQKLVPFHSGKVLSINCRDSLFTGKFIIRQLQSTTNWTKQRMTLRSQEKKKPHPITKRTNNKHAIIIFTIKLGQGHQRAKRWQKWNFMLTTRQFKQLFGQTLQNIKTVTVPLWQNEGNIAWTIAE